MNEERPINTGAEMNGSPHDPSDNRRNRSDDNSLDDQSRRPFDDAGELYEIPRTRPEDPPYRNWWTGDGWNDDEQR